ncbi:RNase adapter RapZ [soil metagenome]
MTDPTEVPAQPGDADGPVDTLLLVTGMSGAGRSTAAGVLEDLGWFVVDNLPPQLIGEVQSLVRRAGRDQARIAVVVDARSRWFFAALQGVLTDLARRGVRPGVLFLEAKDDVLVRRQEAARRPHPLQGDGRLLDGVNAEREMMRELRGLADLVIDTSDLNVHQLSTKVSSAFAGAEPDRLRATMVSFGYKYGIPVDADMVADMRFLPNPFWDPQLRPLSGRDDAVRDSVLGQPDAAAFLDGYEQLLGSLTGGFVREGKRFLTLAIGCTGGRHRSVAMAEALAGRLRGHQISVLVVHRDLGRE